MSKQTATLYFSKMTKRVKFNAGGQYFETTRETIELLPDSFLANMLKNSETFASSGDDDAIFIDCDSQMFRWILQTYRNQGIPPEAAVVGVPEEMWRKELELYFPPPPPEAEAAGENTTTPIETILKSRYARFQSQYLERRKLEAKAAEARKPIYAALLLGGSWTFVWAAAIPAEAHTIKIKFEEKNIDVSHCIESHTWFLEHGQEFQEYANELGYFVKIQHQTGYPGSHFKSLPATAVPRNVWTGREKEVINVECSFIVPHPAGHGLGRE